MPENNLPKLTEIISNSVPYFYFIFLAVWGGIVNYIGKLKKSKIAFSVAELVGEMFISGFAGIIAAYLCVEMNLSFFVTCAISGIAGHMGGRTIYIIETFIQKRYLKVTVQDEREL